MAKHARRVTAIELLLGTDVSLRSGILAHQHCRQPGSDAVLMHFGTNDIWSAISTETITGTYGILVDQMRAHNPNIKILVAQIIPMDPARSCAGCAQRVIELNEAIPTWAHGKSTSQSPIIVVDQWTGFDTDTDTYDGVHPNDRGDQKIADKWYAALLPLLNAQP